MARQSRKGRSGARGGAAPSILVRLEGARPAYAEGLEARCARRLASASAALGLAPAHEISVLFCGSARIQKLNRDFRSKDKPTDVLSFPQQTLKAGQRPAPGPLGDIAVALPVARRQARERGEDFQAHLDLLLVHGLLHLLGHDHMKTAEAEAMEAEERRLLALKL